MKQKVSLAIAVVLLLGLGALLIRLPNNPAKASDFLGYWSAARLMARGQNPYDKQARLNLQIAQGWTEPAPIIAWNPPWLNVLILPVALLPFDLAASTWFVGTPLALGAAAILLSNLYGGRDRASVLVALLATFFFAPAIRSILLGQMIPIVLIGIVGFLWFKGIQRPWLAGASLALTTIKPHLVYLLLPLVLLDALRSKEWRLIGGFVLAMIMLVYVTTILWSGWLGLYVDHLSNSAPTPHANPTIRGLLFDYLGSQWGTYLWLVGLVIGLVYWWFRRGLDSISLVNVSLIGGLPMAVFGWMTDQTLLIVPLIGILSLSLRGTKLAWTAIWGIVAFVYCVVLVQWLAFYPQVSFAWVPFAVGALYAATDYSTCETWLDPRRGGGIEEGA